MVPKYKFRTRGKIYFRINANMVGRVTNKAYRNIRRVKIHENYRIEGNLKRNDSIKTFPLDSNSLYDIALVQFDKSILTSEWDLDNPLSRRTICPICLPDTHYDEIGELGYTMGYGVVSQAGKCHTNGAGPSIYSDCATGTVTGEHDWHQQHWFHVRNISLSISTYKAIKALKASVHPQSAFEIESLHHFCQILFLLVGI